ncbi:TMEM165/GDT1 family protein [Helicovermis profundi]|uniref:GDT1 family protein n=1 Tax=Helicovermis profundi TaxID=3065157 RepID=A0AAU9EB93_9FIRM|nr:hypothetical protein HLPR_09100 [Clostridia bacterium S502]
MFSDYIGAVLLIFFAEMGDKTQFLAIAFATKYPIKKILLGVGIGAFLNHGLAMLLGRILVKFVSGNIITLTAGLMFIYFAFMSLKIDDDETKNTTTKYGAIITVSLAFFLGELGDKTQLAALGLSLNSSYVPFVLLGTVTGMVLTSAIGIFIGLKLGKKIPEDKLKFSSFLMFLLFGFEKIYYSYLHLTTPRVLLLIILLSIIIIFFTSKRFFNNYSKLETTKLKKHAELLKDTKNKIEEKVDILCKGLESCKVCDGNSCLIGYMKSLLKSTNKPLNKEDSTKIGDLKNKNFDKNEAIIIINYLIDYYNKYESEYTNNLQLLKLREAAEVIAFGDFSTSSNYKEYVDIINNKTSYLKVL